MKKIAHILAVYILALAIMPCNDIHPINNDTSNAFEITDEEHHQDMDFCSPFCLCDCCSTVAEMTDIDLMQIEIQPLLIAVFPYFIIEKESIRSFWRPPIV